MTGPGDLAPEVTVAIAPLESGYAALLATAVGIVAADDRLRGLWLGGSCGRGVADTGSDLDLLVAVADASWADVVADLPGLWDALDPVLARPIPGAEWIIAVTTRAGLRCDLVPERVGDLATTPYRHRLRVLDKDGLAPAAPQDDPDLGPDADRMAALVREGLRQAVIFPAAVVAREDWLLGQVGVGNIVRLVYDIFVESARPLPPMGVKQWSSKLPPARRGLLESLPAASANRTSVVLAMTAAVELLCTEGRFALQRAGGQWPDQLAATVAAYWLRHELPDPTELA